MFSCQLPDGRAQIFCARNGSLYTAWKAEARTDSDWTAWEMFHQERDPFFCTGVGAAAGYFPKAGSGQADGFPIVAFAVDKRVPSLEKYSEVRFAAKGMFPDPVAWEFGMFYRPSGNANTARISSLAASTLSGGGVQFFSGIEYSSAFGGVSDLSPLQSNWTDSPASTLLGDVVQRQDPDGLHVHLNKADMASAGTNDAESRDVLKGSARPIHVAAAQLPNGAIQLFAARDTQIITTYKSSAQSNAGWVKWGAFQRTGSMAAMSATRLANGAMALFVLTNSGEVLVSKKEDLSQDAHWTALQGLPSIGLGFGSPWHLAACQLTDNRIQLFVDSGSKIRTSWQRDEGGWTNWSDFEAP